MVESGYYLYGYRSHEVDLKISTPPDATRYSINKSYFNYDETHRPPMGKTFVKHIPAVPPKTDITHPDSLLQGIAKRMAYEPPKYDPKIREEFRTFVKQWLLKNIEPFSSTETFDFEEWLENNKSYELWRKEEIRKARRDFPFSYGEVDQKTYDRHLKEDYADRFFVKLFCKEEFYPEYKHFRGIWAREDAAKAILGPFFAKVEQVLFKLPFFIKKIPKNERPKYINDFMNDMRLKFHMSDYTSFESHFVTDMMNDCEFLLYDHISKNNVLAQRLVRLIFKIIAGTNIVLNKFFTIFVDAKRQSGEMNTSLGNGFSNLMFLLFACYYYNIDFSGPIIEGDDSLMGKNKDIPQDYYDKMGLNVKLEKVDDISEGSFCGLVYDVEELINIRDPRETLCTTVWMPKKYAFCNHDKYFSLLRSKALSLIYEYPGCPIVYPYGKKIFDLLHEYEVLVTSDDMYKKNIIEEAYKSYVENKLPIKDIGPKTRKLMEKVFNIPISQQLIIEKDISYMTIENMNIPSALDIMPACWLENYRNYVFRWEHQTMKSICYPIFPRFPNNKLEGIIKMSKPKLIMNRNLTATEFYSSKINKDPKLYIQYLWRRNNMRRILKERNSLLQQRAVEKFFPQKC